MGTTPAPPFAPASAREAIEMMHAGLGWLAAADAAALGAQTQAWCLRALEEAAAAGTAARAAVLAAFTAGQGYCRGCGLQPAGVADAQDRHHPGRRRGSPGVVAAGGRPSAGGGGAGRPGDVGVLRPHHLRLDR